MKAAPAQPIPVPVGGLSRGNRFVGGPGTGEETVDVAVPRGASVRTVLRALSERFPELGRALWDPTRPRELGDNIEGLVGDAGLGGTHELRSEGLDGGRGTPHRPRYCRWSSWSGARAAMVPWRTARTSSIR